MTVIQQYSDFADTLKSLHPTLFTSVKPLTFNIIQELHDDSISSRQFTMLTTPILRQYLSRFIAEWTTSEDYFSKLIMAYLAGEPRVGLRSEQPILLGEVLEVITRMKQYEHYDQVRHTPLGQCIRLIEHQSMGAAS
ncbi:hypothetical protein AAFX24_28130 [Vibrio mediterranei]|uniref:hypothetical protein n=1 Tax=Vibrio mediterranei TaxID=689 RepID=UPI0038CEABA1